MSKYLENTFTYAILHLNIVYYKMLAIFLMFMDS